MNAAKAPGTLTTSHACQDHQGAAATCELNGAVIVLLHPMMQTVWTIHFVLLVMLLLALPEEDDL